MRLKTRIGTVVALTSAASLALAPSAQANWSGSLKAVDVNYESGRWQDELYS